MSIRRVFKYRKFIYCVFTFVFLFTLSSNIAAQSSDRISSSIKVLKVEKPTEPPERTDNVPAPTKMATNSQADAVKNKSSDAGNLNGLQPKNTITPQKAGKKMKGKTPTNLIPPVAAPPVSNNFNSNLEEKGK